MDCKENICPTMDTTEPLAKPIAKPKSTLVASQPVINSSESIQIKIEPQPESSQDVIEPGYECPWEALEPIPGNSVTEQEPQPSSSMTMTEPTPGPSRYIFEKIDVKPKLPEASILQARQPRLILEDCKKDNLPMGVVEINGCYYILPENEMQDFIVGEDYENDADYEVESVSSDDASSVTEVDSDGSDRINTSESSDYED